MATIADLQIVDYRQRNTDSALGLIAAVYEAKLRRGPLPEPLPDQPPTPFAYLMLLGRAINAPQMNHSEQVVVLAQLRQGLEDEDDANALRDIAVLLGDMRRRPDATYRSVREIDDLLATINQAPPIESETPEPSQLHSVDPNSRNDSVPRRIKHASAHQQPQPRNSSLASNSPKSLIWGTISTLILGLVLLVLAWLLGIPILWTLGILLMLGGGIGELIAVSGRPRRNPPSG